MNFYVTNFVRVHEDICLRNCDVPRLSQQQIKFLCHKFCSCTQRYFLRFYVANTFLCHTS